MNLKKGTLLQKLLRIVSIIDNHKRQYRFVKKWSKRINRVATILEPSDRKTGHSVRRRLEQYLDQVELTARTDEDWYVFNNMERYTRGFSKGLFTCYDFTFLPRTNNDMELHIRTMKTGHRRTTGLRSWNRYIRRHGAYGAFAIDVNTLAEAQDRISHVSEEGYKRQRLWWEPRKERQVKQSRFKKDPDSYLKTLEERWEQC